MIALRDIFDPSTFTNPTAVTLTMKKRAGGQPNDPITASNNFRHFRNRLNHFLLGSAAKRFGRKVPMVAVMETSADGRFHYHALIDRPHYWSFSRFSDVIREQWLSTGFGYREIDIQDYATIGWTDYMLKRRQKTSLLDSIDWANCHLIAE